MRKNPMAAAQKDRMAVMMMVIVFVLFDIWSLLLFFLYSSIIALK
jgi:hypothetical protein